MRCSDDGILMLVVGRGYISSFKYLIPCTKAFFVDDAAIEHRWAR